MNVRSLLPLILSLSICWVPFFFSGCSDVTPALTAVEATVVYEYVHFQTVSQQRLSVFVQEAEGTERIMELVVNHQGTGIQWYIDKPMVVYNGSMVKAGSANLMPPYFSSIPTGEYDVVYTDLAGKTVSDGFSLNYSPVDGLPLDQPVLEKKMEQDESPQSAEPVRRIAVYAEQDGQGTLLFLDKARSNWESLSDILKDYSDAKSLRLCLDYPSRQVRYLLPPQNIEPGE